MPDSAPDPSSGAAFLDVKKLFETTDDLTDPLPADPGPIFRRWFDTAHGQGEGLSEPVQPNPNAFTLSTLSPDGSPNARIVLCKTLDTETGCLIFHTNYQGQKSRDIDHEPRVAATFHWDRLDRQVRVRGIAKKVSDAESDPYFQTRPWERKLGAWTSDQSEPIGTREDLLRKAADKARELGLDTAKLEPWDRSVFVPRPPHWGGWRIWFQKIELWCAGPGRIHDRAVWTRQSPVDAGPAEWSAPQRLQP